MQEQSYSAGDTFAFFLQTLQSGAGLAALFVLVLLALVLWIFPAAKWAVLSLIMYISTLGFYETPWFRTQVVAPIEFCRVHSRNLCIGLMLLLLWPTVLGDRGLRRRLALGGTIAYFVFEILYSVRISLGGEMVRGVVGAAVFTLVFTIFGLGVSKWIRSVRDAYLAIGSIAGAGLLFVLGTLACLATNPSAIVWENRLISTTFAATNCGEIIATTLIPCTFLVVQKQVSTAWRALFAVVTGMLVVFLIWTGTRTGLVMALPGLALTFRLRIGKMSLALVLIGAVALLGAQLFTGSTEGMSRLATLQDTRSVTWRGAWDDFMRNPVIGVVEGGPLITENSYLTILAKCGVVGALPMAAAIVLTTTAIRKMRRFRPPTDMDPMLRDLLVGGLVSLAAGAVFEGYLLGTFMIQVLAIYVYLGVLSFIIDKQDLAVEARLDAHQASATGAAEGTLVAIQGF